MNSKTNEVAVIVLAAGKGSRMQSNLPKVLQPLQGKPMIKHLLTSINALDAAQCVVVIADGMEDVKSVVAPLPTVIQKQQRGTGDAVQAASTVLADFTGDVLVVYGDTPLISTKTLQRLLNERRARTNSAVVVLGFRPVEPGHYGRLSIGTKGELKAIVEYLDCDDSLKASNLCNSGVMAFDGRYLFNLLAQINNDNAKGEYYLTDVVAIAIKQGLPCAFIEADPLEVLGINTKAELQQVETLLS